MHVVATDPQFKLFAGCAVVLSLQMLFLAAYTAATRSRVKHYLNPEDAKVSFHDAQLNNGAEHADVARILRAHRNLNESLPLFFSLGLLCLLAGAAPLASELCFGAFTVARLLHSFVYIKGLQPWRTMSYGVGTLALLGMSVLIVLAIVS